MLFRFLIIAFIYLTLTLGAQSNKKLLKDLQLSINQFKSHIDSSKFKIKHITLYKDTSSVKEFYLDTINNFSLLIISNTYGEKYSWYYQNEYLELHTYNNNFNNNYKIYFKNLLPVIFFSNKRRMDLTELKNQPKIESAIKYGLQAISIFVSPLGIN